MTQRFTRQALFYTFIQISMAALVTAALARGARDLFPSNHPANAAIQIKKEMGFLAAGKSREQELKVGETHQYHIRFHAGQFLYAVVDQQGINLMVVLYDPDDRQTVEVDSPNGRQGPEVISVIAHKSGIYRLEVRSRENDALTGRYEIKINELRAATARDRKIVAAERAFRQAESLRAEGTAESLPKSARKYKEALPLYRVAGDHSGEAVTFNNIGIVYNLLGEKQKALNAFKRALPLYRAIKDGSGEALTLENIGEVYDDLGEKRKALDHLAQALSLYRIGGDRSGEAETLNSIAKVHDDLNEKRKALDNYFSALTIYRGLGDRRGEAATLTSIGTVYESIDNKQKALYNFAQSLPLYHAAGDHSGEAITLNDMGAIYDDLGEKQKALNHYLQALKLQEEIGAKADEATTLNNIGTIYDSLGEKQKALDYYAEALRLHQGNGDHHGEAAVLNNIGSVYYDLGEKQKALDNYFRALQQCRDSNDRGGGSATLNNIGKVYNDIGEKQKALDYYERALALTRTIGDRRGEATTINNIGEVYDTMGKKKEALDNYFRALSLFQSLEDPASKAMTLTNMGVVYKSLGRTRDALDSYSKALSLYMAVGDPRGEATTLNNIGRVYDETGEQQKALDHFAKALSLFQAVGDFAREGVTLHNIGAVYEDLGDKQKALAQYQQAISKFESIRTTMTIEEIKIGLAEEAAITYERAILLLMQAGQQEQAFDLSERARARSFLDQLGNIRPNIHKTTNIQLLHEEQNLAFGIKSLENRLRQEQSKPLPIRNADKILLLKNELAAGQRHSEELLTQLKLSNPEYVTLRTVNTLPLNEIQKLLDEDTSLISYFITSEKTLAFIITRTSFQVVEIRVKESALNATISSFRNFANLQDSEPESLKQLKNWLITPLKQCIRTPVLGIIPHGILHYLPFAALMDETVYFGEQHTLFYLPSASVLPFIKAKSKPVGAQVLAVAQSQIEGMSVLRYADAEARSVADLYNMKAFTTNSMSKADFLKRVSYYSIVHIAAHAELNATSPLFSSILLALNKNKDVNGSLNIKDVYDLDLSKASLVVLSACETNLGPFSKGDDVIALNRAFIYAGTPTVIASLWVVDDESTSYLMKAFYTNLKRGMSKAGALRAAQSDTRKKYSHPYYWAGFVLTGDPGMK